jgi:hypothetical protein
MQMDRQIDLCDAVKRCLVAEVVRTFGEARMKVTGTSMLPSVRCGDILIIHRCRPAELLLGQIVLCYRNQSFVAHRLVSRVGNHLITRGDSLCNYDRPFRVDEVVGQVVSILRDGKEIPVQPTLSLPSRSVAWLMRHSGLCMRQWVRWQRLTSYARARTAGLVE